MRVVIVGAGEVGTSIAQNLASAHDVVVIDCDEDRVEKLTYELDVLSLAGDGTSLSTLEEADVAESDMVIASTDDDKTNLVTCGTAKTIADVFTIARVKSPEFLRTWERTEQAFGVDFLVCSDLLTAQDIVRVIGLPAAHDVDPFAGGLVQMAEFDIDGDSPVGGQTVEEADRYESLTFAGLFRDGELILPRGETCILAGDRVVVIGSPESVQAFAKSIAPSETPGNGGDIVVLGGSEIGYQTARLLEERGLNPKLIEQDPERARQLAEELPGTLVMEHDATDTEFLTREHVDEAEVVVSALDGDEKNLLVSVLARRLGVERIVAVVDNSDYVQIFEEIGIDVAVHPRQVTAEEITRFTHSGVAENIAVLEHDQAEVLEIELAEGSDLAGRSIRELVSEIDADVVIGAITRNRELITPRGETVLEPGDHIVVFVETAFVDDVMSMV
ncbi:MAG: Trk system potassium transporter TrkA [Natronomonas sp.]